MTRGLARNFGLDNIGAGTLLPGRAMSARRLARWVDEAGEKGMDTKQCLRGRVYRREIARVVLLLAAADGAMGTARNVILDAGRV